MQTVASKVVVVDGPEDEVKEYIAATVILHDFGLAVKNDAGLSLYTWDRVKQITWSEPQVINQVWGLMLAQLAADLDFDEEYLWDEDEEDPYSNIEVEETTPTPTEESTEETKEPESKEEKTDDDPYVWGGSITEEDKEVIDVDPETGRIVDLELVSKDLTTKLKDIRDNDLMIWSKVIANPHAYSTEAIDDLRRNVVMLAAVLMEHDVKIEVPKKERTPEDVIKEGMGELGLMLGSKAVGGALSFWRRMKDDMMDYGQEYQEEDDEYYQRDDGSYFFVDPETGEEVECDKHGEEI